MSCVLLLGSVYLYGGGKGDFLLDESMIYQFIHPIIFEQKRDYVCSKHLENNCCCYKRISNNLGQNKR